MDRKERLNDLPTALLTALGGWQAGLWTAMPAVIVSYDPAAMTCVAQPTIQGTLLNEDGSQSNRDMPLLLDVPILFPSGGGFTLTFPIAAGDECLVIFASRCIDSWWQLGGIRSQAELRMHDLSDGFAFVGPRSQPRVIPSPSTTATQLRSDDGVTYVEVDNTQITIVAATVVVNATTVDVNATDVTVDCDNAAITASAVASVTAPSISLKNLGTALRSLINSDILAWLTTHVHSGVVAGGGNTGAPTTSPGAETQTTVVQAE